MLFNVDSNSVTSISKTLESLRQKTVETVIRFKLAYSSAISILGNQNRNIKKKENILVIYAEG